MARYAVRREFRPDLWADEAVDFLALMKTMLSHQMWKACVTPVAGAEPEVQLSDDVLRPGWGCGVAVIEVEG